MKFNVDTKAHDLKAGFQHEMEAETMEAALDSCVRDLVAAHALSGRTPCKTSIVIWQDGNRLGEWVLDLAIPKPERVQ